MAVDNGIFLIGVVVMTIYLFMYRYKEKRLWASILLLATGIGTLYIGTTTQEDLSGMIIFGIGLIIMITEIFEAIKD